MGEAAVLGVRAVIFGVGAEPWGMTEVTMVGAVVVDDCGTYAWKRGAEGEVHG